MSRGRLVAPNLDDRTWREIVEQAKGLIPRYAPEWTDHNPSDLGITLIELFAWMSESMIYRLNRVPEKNYIEFLNLLGITRDPATPASALITYQSIPNQPPVEVPQGHQVGTRQTETEDALLFETDSALKVLPINLDQAWCFYLQEEPSHYEDVTAALVGAPLTGKMIPVPAEGALMIVLGFDGSSPEEIELKLQFSQPVLKHQLKLSWHYSTEATLPQNWQEIETVIDGTDGCQHNGPIQFQVPTDWSEQVAQNWPGFNPDLQSSKSQASRFWIGMKITNVTHEPIEEDGASRESREIEVTLDHLLFNSVLATNALTISQPDLLGVSNGEPFQAFELQNYPLFKEPRSQNPYQHLVIQTREALENDQFGEWVDWHYREDLPPGAGHCYRLDPVSGTITFGNFHPTLAPDGHGSIPRANSEVRALTYRYVIGGTQGNVPSGSIQVIREPLPNIAKVTNLGPASGGIDQEAVEETKRRAPEVLRNRYRAITPEDYEYLAREASIEVERVRCLSPRFFNRYDAPDAETLGKPWTYGGLDRGSGSVNLLIIPAISPENPSPRPMPSEDLLREVSNYLDARSPVATRLNVTYPRYLPISVVADIRVWQRAFDNGLLRRTDYQEQVEAEMLAKINQFLHPLLGGLDGQGWQIGQEITVSSLYEKIQPDTEVGFIADLKLVAQNPFYEPQDRPYETNEPLVRVPVADYEIVCSGSNHQINIERLR